MICLATIHGKKNEFCGGDGFFWQKKLAENPKKKAGIYPQHPPFFPCMLATFCI
jgi:hypothetical protein